MNIKKAEIKLNTVVDTLQTAILREHIGNYGVIEADNRRYIKMAENVRVKENYRKLKISPKHLIGYENTNSRKKIEEANMKIINEIGVKVDNVEVERMDISIDSSLKYEDYVKFHLYLFELITFKERHNKKMICSSLVDYKENNIYLNSRDLKLSIYNKALESGGLHPYDTRIEFRWIRYVSMDTKKSAEKVINKLKDIEKNNVELVTKVVKQLSELYVEEIEKDKVKSFTEFVRKYDKYFYNKEIVEGVYKNSSLKGSFNEWFKKFKATHSFDYYNLKDVITYRDLMVKSVKSYMKS